MGGKVALPFGTVAALGGLVAYPFFVSDYRISFMMELLTWVALTESWLIISGYTGYISLGHAAFYGLGAYLMVFTWHKIPFLVGVALGGVAAGAFAWAIGFPFLRVRGPYFVILTLGLSEFVKYVFINFEIKLAAKGGRMILGAPSIQAFYFYILVLAVLSTAVAAKVRQSRFGSGLLCIKGDEEAAESLGLNTSFYKWLAFGLSAVIPGSVGAVMASRWTYIDPMSVFDPIVSFQIVVIALLGGKDNIYGPVVGAVVLTVLSEQLSTRYPEFYLILIAVIVFIAVIFMPSGILASVRSLAIARKG